MPNKNKKEKVRRGEAGREGGRSSSAGRLWGYRGPAGRSGSRQGEGRRGAPCRWGERGFPARCRVRPCCPPPGAGEGAVPPRGLARGCGGGVPASSRPGGPGVRGSGAAGGRGEAVGLACGGVRREGMEACAERSWRKSERGEAAPGVRGGRPGPAVS